MKKSVLAILLLAAMLCAVTACGKKEPPASEPEETAAPSDGPAAEGISAAAASDDLFDRVCPADEALRLAKGSDTVVLEGLTCTSGQAVMTDFYETVSAGNPAVLLAAHYDTLDPERVSPELYEAEKDNYPMLFFYRVSYDGESFTVSTRLSTEAKPESTQEFRYLLHLAGDYAPPVAFDAYDNYVLTNDPDVTWEEIEASMVSSQALSIIPHCAVYSTAFNR